MSERSLEPDFKSYWDGLEAFADTEVAAYGMFRTVVGGLGRRRGRINAFPAGQRISYTYPTIEVVKRAGRLYQPRRISITETRIIAPKGHFVQVGMHVALMGEDVLNLEGDEFFRRPGVSVDPSDQSFCSFASWADLLRGHPEAMAAEQAAYVGWLDVITDAQIAADFPR